MKLFVVSLLILVLWTILTATASLPGNNVVTPDGDEISLVSTYNAQDVRHFRQDLTTQLGHLRDVLAHLELEFEGITMCLNHLNTWFPSIPIWLESHLVTTDKLGTFIVRSLDEIDRIIRLLDAQDIDQGVSRADMLSFRLMIDGARYRRLIARRFRNLYRAPTSSFYQQAPGLS